MYYIINENMCILDTTNKTKKTENSNSKLYT